MKHKKNINQENIKNYFENKIKLYSKIKSNKFFYFIKKKELSIFKKIAIFKKKDSIIDLASGSGFYLNNINNINLKDIYAVDISQKMLNLIKKKNIKKICSSVEDLKIKKKFNKILCFGLLEFVEDVNIILKKIYSLSTFNSEIYLLVPKNNLFGMIYKIYHLFNGLKIRLMSKNKLTKILNKNKFNIIKYEQTFLSLFLKVKKYG